MDEIRKLPFVVRVLVEHVVDPRWRDVVAADIAELYALRSATEPRWKARWWAVRDAISVAFLSTDYQTAVLPGRRRPQPGDLAMSFLRDLRHAGRSLLRAPGFAAVVVATLAIAIGANTVIFGVVDGVLLRALPYDEPDRLMVVKQVGDVPDDQAPSGVSQTLFLEWRENTRTLEAMAMYSLEAATVTIGDSARRLNGLSISPAGFTVLRVRPLVGGVFAPDAELPGNDDVIAFTHRAWLSYFGGDPEVVGTRILVDGRPHTVIGILPEGMAFPDPSVEYWVPMLATPPAGMTVAVGADEPDEGAPPPPRRGGQVEERTETEGPDGEGETEAHLELWGRLVARLAPGMTPEAAALEGTGLAQALDLRGPDDGAQHVEVVSLQEQVVGAVRRPLLMLMGAVGFVLLIACANIANLVLARSIERRRETAVRAAIGAGLGGLLRFSLAESLWLCGLGGAAGLLLALAGLRGVVALAPSFIPRLTEVTLDLRVVAFTVAVTGITAIVFGLLPVRQAAKLDLNRALKDDYGVTVGGRRGLRRVLVVAEMALAVALMVGAGLLVASFLRLTSVDPGYDPDNLLYLSISLPPASYADAESHLAYYDRLVERLEALAPVEAATVASGTPFARANIQIAVDERTDDEPAPVDARPTPVGVRMVEPGYFDAIGAPAIAGRPLSRDDRPETEPVAVVSRAGAKALFGDRDPVDREMDFIGGQRLRVVGVVEDARTAGVDPTPMPDIFLPYRQAPGPMVPMLFRTAHVFVRTRTAPLTALPDVRNALLGLDPNVVLVSASTVRDQLADAVAEPRFYAALVAAFALLSVTLAAIGVYGMLAYVVEQGVRDTAIRRALGAPAREILGRVMREGMVMAVTGLVVGVAIAVALGRTLASMLYEIEPTDPASIGAAAAFFVAVAALAVWIPARRALRIDPMEVLRSE